MKRLAGGLALALALCSCGNRHSDSDGTINITVSIEPQRALLEAIGGERVSVSSLLANGADPETYDPTMASLMHLEKSEAWLQMGYMDFENELASRLSSGRKALRYYNTSEGIELIEGTHSHNHAHDEGNEEDDHHGHSHNTFDPHTWSSVKNMKVIASNMLDALIEIDPTGTDYYHDRYERLESRLDSLDAVYSNKLKDASGMAFMVWHPSLSYFARDYGLRQISVTSDHRETSLLELQKTIDGAIDEGVEVFFEQSSYDPRLSATVKRHIDAVCVKFDPLDYDWQKGLDAVVNALAGHIPGAGPISARGCR